MLYEILKAISVDIFKNNSQKKEKKKEDATSNNMHCNLNVLQRYIYNEGTLKHIFTSNLRT